MIDKVQQWVRQSPSFKLLVVGLITLLLLIPGSSIESLIEERQDLRSQVVQEIATMWGQGQTLSGPVVTVPYTVLVNRGTPQELVETRYLHLLPSVLRIEAKLNPEFRYRSIYKAVLYEADVELKADFELPGIWHEGDSAVLQWSEAVLSLMLTDPRGIASIGDMSWNGTALEMRPGLPQSMPLASGVNAALPAGSRKAHFEGSLRLRGCETWYMAPLGKTTYATVTAPWGDPQFDGAFLPERKVGPEGFSATWNVLDYNRSFGQQWDNTVVDLQPWTFGVKLLDTVDVYQKTMRSVKYAFLIIALTFTFFFFFEILRKLRIHPIQYVIVGFALLIFYVLLLALAEHMAFALAFVVSAVAIVAAVGYYFFFISRSWRVTLVFSGLFAFIYAFIYVLLTAEAYSLLIGSIGLLLLVILIMHFTRNVNWYTIGDGDETDEKHLANKD